MCTGVGFKFRGIPVTKMYSIINVFRGQIVSKLGWNKALRLVRSTISTTNDNFGEYFGALDERDIVIRGTLSSYNLPRKNFEPHRFVLFPDSHL
jgi:hypothetical protein